MEWLWTNWHDVGVAAARAVCVIIAVLVLTRLTGLRSYAKMSSTDFFTTLAIGSGIAAVILNFSSSLVASLVAIALLFGFQWLSARLERAGFEGALNNAPVLLMAGERVLEDRLAQVNCTKAGIYAKLREASVTHPDQILAVVFETTGDISVLHSDASPIRYDPAIFDGITGAEALRDTTAQPEPAL